MVVLLILVLFFFPQLWWAAYGRMHSFPDVDLADTGAPAPTGAILSSSAGTGKIKHQYQAIDPNPQIVTLTYEEKDEVGDTSAQSQEDQKMMAVVSGTMTREKQGVHVDLQVSSPLQTPSSVGVESANSIKNLEESTGGDKSSAMNDSNDEAYDANALAEALPKDELSDIQVTSAAGAMEEEDVNHLENEMDDEIDDEKSNPSLVVTPAASVAPVAPGETSPTERASPVSYVSSIDVHLDGEKDETATNDEIRGRQEEEEEEEEGALDEEKYAETLPSDELNDIQVTSAAGAMEEEDVNHTENDDMDDDIDEEAALESSELRNGAGKTGEGGVGASAVNDVGMIGGDTTPIAGSSEIEADIVITSISRRQRLLQRHAPRRAGVVSSSSSS